jgi:squalene-hopene/tetraprenyl-beta-curcumene cyclase
VDYLPVKKALRYLYKTQRNDGSWYGRWGVNYIYGTSKSLQAFDSIGYSFESAVLKAERWLQGIQNKDGGWGESCKSYEDKRYVPLKISTASQTAWALCGLLCSKDASISGHIKNGINFLIDTQDKNGNWLEDYFTGGGFPKAFYLKYEMYKTYFPLIALAKYKIIKNEQR